MLPGWVDVDDMDKKLVPYYRKPNILFTFLPLYSSWGYAILPGDVIHVGGFCFGRK